ncbi:MAG TPA: glyceraldehyde-3-phosphate:ferredoxin oxidoreductase, partial [Thermococcus paralvinellae]|nr:glyceraldehyde-3-phosphate:ferredoxin oxidoreductase [Thermococcus paralvinellae]
MKFTVLKIKLDSKDIEMESIEKEGIYGIIDYALYLHDEVYKTYELDFYDPKNVTVFGKGPFAGSVLPGAHRLMFVFRSPLYGVLFPSAMGGAAYHFQRVGVDFVVLEGKRDKPTVILLQGDGENVNVELHEI